MDDLRCDVAIIGAGTAGIAAERAARKAGAKTLLIDDREVRDDVDLDGVGWHVNRAL